MRTPAEGRSSAHQFSDPRSGPANNLSPILDSGDSAILKSSLSPLANLVAGHATESPLLPSRPPPEPSSRNCVIDSGNTIRSPSSTANKGCAAHDHGIVIEPVFLNVYASFNLQPSPDSRNSNR